MKVKIESSTIVKPAYGSSPPPPITADVPLSCFDKVAYDSHVGVIYVFRKAVPTATLRLGLRRVLAVYREWTGRLGKNHNGESVILLNDRGVRFVEASVDRRLDQAVALVKPSPALLSLLPPVKGVDELLQVQVTNFACGSMVVGFTTHHSVADGHATSNFLSSWGRVCRGLDVGPVPIRDRSSYFVPRDQPEIKFDHFGEEYTSREIAEDETTRFEGFPMDDIVMDKIHFSSDFLKKLKARASISDLDNNNNNTRSATYSTFECVMAHLWRTTTRARSLSADETTHMRISVNGRSRISNPRVPNNYFGNLVLWAVPKARVKDLLREPLPHAAKLIHNAIAKVDESYFKSFIDFAATELKNIDRGDAVPTANIDKPVMCPDVDVDSWLRLPFNELDFGGGSPYMFMPMYYPIEGTIFVLPSNSGDGGIDSFVSVFRDQLECFRQNCCVLD